MEYTSLFKRLYEEEVEYLVCGGLAVNIYGIPRMTADIDLLIKFDEENVARFNKAIQSLDFAPRLPLQLSELTDEKARQEMISSRNLIAYSFYNTRLNYMNIDVLIDVPLSFDGMWKAREKRRIEDIEVYIVSLEDLIKLKEYANRTQDQQDILMLSKLKNLPPKV
ncbi:nucleotidyl transferase AbiEii/AbiGii toxin family protein [Limibacter armeniacum]|uniref:nucleotidyl transferase AbiEii/AbiGii toxin family protein n=1 Tax=Limibacter armeniacum TaxID=466084 RepID=UPI002FE54D67